MSGEPKDLARGTSTIAEEAVDQLQENEKLVAGEGGAVLAVEVKSIFD